MSPKNAQIDRKISNPPQQPVVVLSRWSHVVFTWPACAHCARSGTVGPAERQDGPQDRPSSRKWRKVSPGDCTSERIVEQTVEPALSDGEAQPPEIAKHSDSTGPEKSLGEAQHPEIVKHSVTAAGTTVAKSVGVGDARSSEIAWCRATTAATVTKSPGVGGARTPEIAKYGRKVCW